ncbi:glycosyl transferase [Halobacillus andaensis]|uniref:Glycosyl transferase n=1 Tax=Halobacillus andaensis TaxID=1176239 RepID=A0A917B9A7_HALAA|nr:glycosyltransferase [Halobacillus andaensis]MBP2005392.1 glycosyltransferase involved in cell wall biosynthesis [Halobacillus andaensis]GGF31127.1 glycosyl transferase [Halobacillus andaensis]
MKILHLNAGNETGGGMSHILSLLNMLDHDEVVLGVLEDGEMFHKARELSIDTVNFKQSFPYDLSVLFHIKRYIENENIDMVHTHGPRANVLMNILKPSLSIPWILTLHSNPDDDFMGHGVKGSMFAKLHKCAIRQADHCLAISESFKKLLHTIGVANEKISTIYNGIDFNVLPNQNSYREELGFVDSDFLIGMVARLEPVKQHELAIESFAELNKKNPNTHLVLIGNGSREHELKQLCSQNNLERHVHFFGHREDVSSILPLMDVTLLTSKSESFPLVLLESARARVPVITTNVGGVPQLVPSNKYGWVTECEDLTKTLHLAYEKNKDERQVMGDRFYHFARSRYSSNHLAQQVTKIYDIMYKLPIEVESHV